MQISCIILARGGSKGIPKKNIINFCGHPLISWTIKQAKRTKLVTDIWVSSDSPEILNVAKEFGANVILRPENISGDNDSSEKAWIHAVNYIEKKINKKIDYVLAPQVTSPIRHYKDFLGAIKQIVKDGADSLLSVCEIEDFFIWGKDKNSVNSINYDFRNRLPRQKIKKRYLENGSFYIFKPSILKNNNNRLGGAISLYMMDRHKMFQIDNIEDIELTSIVMKGFKLDKL